MKSGKNDFAILNNQDLEQVFFCLNHMVELYSKIAVCSHYDVISFLLAKDRISSLIIKSVVVQELQVASQRVNHETGKAGETE